MTIKMLVMDVDGTLTDGRIYVDARGEVMKAFDVRDGYAIAHMLPEMGVIPVIITGKSSQIVAERAKTLKIEEVYQGISDKLAQLKVVEEKYGVLPEEIAYIGDDTNDLDCIHYCGLTACPKDALNEVLPEVMHVCSRDGGRGAVREFVSIIKTVNQSNI